MDLSKRRRPGLRAPDAFGLSLAFVLQAVAAGGLDGLAVDPR